MAKKRIRSNKEFELALKKIREELYAAAINYGLYTHLVEAGEKYRKEYFRCRLLWGMVQDGLLSQTVLTLCRIYDSDGTNSLETLLKWKEKTGVLSGDIDSWSDDLGSIQRSDPMVSKLKDWRGNVLAHTSLDRVLGRRKPPPNMVPHHPELLALIDRAMDIISRHGGSSVSRSLAKYYVPEREVDLVFESVKQQLVTTEASIREWYTERGVNPELFLDPEAQFEEWLQKNHLS